MLRQRTPSSDMQDTAESDPIMGYENAESRKLNYSENHWEGIMPQDFPA